MRPHSRPILLLDLDGTLVDAAPGITGSCRRTMRELGVSLLEDDDLIWMVGPPLRSSLRRLVGTNADLDEALQRYRHHYSTWGLYQSVPYPGVREALAALVGDGIRLMVCTAKSTASARSLIDHVELTPFVSHVYGSGSGATSDDKAALVGRILLEQAARPHKTCMAGDRMYDVLAARAHGLTAIGALWGYGSRAELEAAGADVLIQSPAELLDLGRRGLFDRLAPP